MKNLGFLLKLLPWVAWLGVAYLLVEHTTGPSWLSSYEWAKLCLFMSPMLVWVSMGMLEIFGVTDFKKIGGKNNWLIAWALFFYGISAEPSSLFHLPSPSVVATIVFVLNLLLTFPALLRSFVTPAQFRRALDMELNLIRFGTTWKPSKLTSKGSARLGNPKIAARYYKDGDVIFGTAKQMQPESESKLGSVIRHVLTQARKVEAVAHAIWLSIKGVKQESLKITYNNKVTYQPVDGANKQQIKYYKEQGASIKKVMKTIHPSISEQAKQNLKALSNSASQTALLRGDFNGHLITVSGSGGGKTVSMVIPNALNYKAGSFICIDPKSEVHAVTKSAREKLGHQVYKLKSGDAQTDTFNAIGWIDPDHPKFTSNCLTVSSWLFSTGDGGDDAGGYYQETAKRLFSFTLAYQIAEYKKQRDMGEPIPFPSLLDVYDFLFQSPSEIQDAIAAIYEDMKALPETSTIYGSATQQIKTWAGSFVGGDQEKTWPNTVSSVQKEIWWIKDNSISSIVCGETPQFKIDSTGREFDVAEILNGKTSVFICIPLATLESTPSVAKLIVGAFLNAIFQSEGKNRGSTLFMIDEMQVLGKFDILHKTALNQGRGYGITLCGIIQAPEALDNQAGKGTFESWIDNTMLQQYFMIGGAETAEKISKQIGDCTVEQNNYSGSVGGEQKGKQGINVGKNYEARRVLTATEVMNLDRTYAVVFRRVGVDDKRVGKLPMVVGTSFYKAIPELADVADDNPYERLGVEDDAALTLPEGNLVKILLDKQAAREALAEQTKAEALKESSDHYDEEWNDADVKVMARQLAEEDEEAKRILDIIDRYYDDPSSVTEEEKQALVAEHVISSDAIPQTEEAPEPTEEEEKDLQDWEETQSEYEGTLFDEVGVDEEDYDFEDAPVRDEIEMDRQEIEEMHMNAQTLNVVNDGYAQDAEDLLRAARGE